MSALVRLALPVVALVLVAGCEPADDLTALELPREGPISAELLEPLTAMGPCPDVDLEADPAAEDVDGLVLPEGSTATSVVVQGPLTTVQGVIPMTPIQVRVFYGDHPELEAISLEDEVRESESLLTDADHRLFVKAQAICEQQSRFLAVIGPGDEAGAVPVPAGGIPAPLD